MDFEAAQDALMHCEVFRNMNKVDRGLLLINARPRTYVKNEVIYVQGEHSGNVFSMIVAGKVGVVKDEGEHVQSIGPNQVIGEIGIVSPEQRRTFSVVAEQETDIIHWIFNDVQEIPGLLQSLQDLAWTRISYYLK